MKILLRVALCLSIVAIAQAQTTLQVRLAEAQPANDLTAITVAHSNDKVYLHPSSIITNADVTEAHVVPHGTTFNVALSLSPEGSTKLARATEAHIGRPIAILVNGNVVAAPIVRSTITQGVVINGDLSKQEAEMIVSALTGK